MINVLIFLIALIALWLVTRSINLHLKHQKLIKVREMLHTERVKSLETDAEPIDINFELYKIFYFTAVKLSFTKAADELYVTQSSVSQSIKLLETKLDTKLFIRNKKQIQLTSEGEILSIVETLK